MYKKIFERHKVTSVRKENDNLIILGDNIPEDITFPAATTLIKVIISYQKASSYDGSKEYYTKSPDGDAYILVGEGEVNEENYKNFYEQKSNEIIETFKDGNDYSKDYYIDIVQYVEISNSDLNDSSVIKYRRLSASELREILIRTIRNKEKIHIEFPEQSDVEVEKRMASKDEMIYIKKEGAPIIFINLIVPAETVTSSGLGAAIFESFGEDIETYMKVFKTRANAETPSKTYVHIRVLYKELNPEYRSVLNSGLIELALHEAIYDVSTDSYYTRYDKIIEKLNKNRDDEITKDSLNSIRYIDNGESIFIKDYDGVLLTTRIYQYQYGNPYIARRANESEIITYFYGDNYISNNYGKYEYEKNEISRFLDIYQETRDYYYKVLLNDSFINEPDYKTYEKLFIIFWSIERTITDKAEQLKNFDSYTKNDVFNFLDSYGMSDLKDTLAQGNYAAVETYAKELLENYLTLVQNKGSKKVIEELEKIFSIGSTDLKLYRNIMIGRHTRKDANSDISSNDGDNTEYEFNDYRISKIPYDDRDVSLFEIVNGANTGELALRYVEGDPYWKVDLENTAELKKRNANYVTTKYLSAEFTNEVSKAYNLNQVILSMLLANINNDVTEDIVLNFSDLGISKYMSPTTLYSRLTLEQLSRIIIELTARYYSAVIGKAYSPDDSYFSYEFKISSEENPLDALDLGVQYEDSSSNLRNNSDIVASLKNSVEAINILSNRISKEDTRFSNLISDALYIPKFILEGKAYTGNISSTLFYKVQDIFNKAFVSSNDENGVLGNDLWNFLSESLDGDAVLLRDAITLALLDLKAIVGTAIEYNLLTATNDLKEFLLKSIDFFISYTSEIKDFEYTTEYKNMGERAVSLLDRFTTTIDSIEIDSFFYDEKLTVAVTSKDQGGEYEK